jgi:subtilisin-like proprotein convertase family protein
MKKALLLCLAAFPALLNAQTFTNTTVTGIPDDGSTISIPITVSGLPTSINSSYGLGSVCLTIVHTYDSDLELKLKSPDNSTVILFSGVGSAGDNFTSTCLANNGINGYITNGVAPFTGSYVALNSLNLFNNNQNPNGTWNFLITDTYPFADSGTVFSLSLTFISNPPADPGPPPVLCTFCSCPGGTPNCDLLPDMTAHINPGSLVETAGNINFDNYTPNIGWGPLEIHGVDTCFCNDTVPVPCSTSQCPDLSYPKQRVHQVIYQRVNDSDTLQQYERPAGTMSWHPSHGHIHVDHWADFTLRTPTSDPDARTWPIVGNGTKQSFCLINLGNCNSPGICVDSNGNGVSQADIPNWSFGLVSGCGLQQGIWVGNYDLYVAGLNMGIDLTGACNGDYYIVSITDPENNMLETSDNNNWTAIPVTLTQQTGTAPVITFTPSQIGEQVGNTAVGIPVGATWVWDFGDGTTDTVNNPAVHTYLANGTYTIQLTVVTSCGTYVISHTVIITTVGISEPFSLNNYYLSVYPNPVTSTATISYYLMENENVELELFDALGQNVVSLYNRMQGAGSHEMKINLKQTGLANGIYYVKLITSQRELACRISIVN